MLKIYHSNQENIDMLTNVQNVMYIYVLGEPWLLLWVLKIHVLRNEAEFSLQLDKIRNVYMVEYYENFL